jgi:hypothetical protein
MSNILLVFFFYVFFLGWGSNNKGKVFRAHACENCRFVNNLIKILNIEQHNYTVDESNSRALTFISINVKAS